MFIFLLNLIKSRSFNHFALQCYNNCNVYLGMNQFEVKLYNSKTDSDDGFVLDLNYHSGLLGIDRAFLCNKYNKLDVCQLPKKNIFLIFFSSVSFVQKLYSLSFQAISLFPLYHNQTFLKE